MKPRLGGGVSLNIAPEDKDVRKKNKTTLDTAPFSILPAAKIHSVIENEAFFVADWITEVSHPILMNIFLWAESLTVHLVFFFSTLREHNWLRINLMFCRGHPVLWLTEHVKPATFPAVIPWAKVITPTSRCLQGASRRIASYCWCHAAVCSNSVQARPGVADWQIWGAA